MPDYSVIDFPPIVRMIFHPRKAYSECPENAFDLSVPVDDDDFVEVGTRLYVAGEERPTLLYFHGNGEVVYDYDNIAPIYNNLGMNLFVADYRGYGASGGFPSFAGVCNDARTILKAVKKELAQRGFVDDLWVMGRSLGSLSALELASTCPDQIKGLIIESGFANVVRVMKNLDHFPQEKELPQFDQECLEMVQKITVPTLIIHGDEDWIVPHREGVFIYENLGTENKKMVTIVNAGHNDIMMMSMRDYFGSIMEFIVKYGGK